MSGFSPDRSSELGDPQFRGQEKYVRSRTRSGNDSLPSKDLYGTGEAVLGDEPIDPKKLLKDIQRLRMDAIRASRTRKGPK